MSPSPAHARNVLLLPLNMSPQTNIGAVLCYLIFKISPLGPVSYHPNLT